ncbi:hypothetical protein GUITHDRAFT_104007 [Guillardia theta CCMP2712]|uniref:EF-hand domain-containing protein n=1 Tax=Guillardia theta (strain CCMP2712) TaxID=905079 RepID=L1JPS5_GUITC|nr:hypothetical protein GUITHDRAFT_104007 [Guillardia theta CCMP2712]EKX50195.1 hypothetical protein GUITHDRAFT_104007 [Guillardia theta CCMP2712]|eukprot:XP_005837175.1 hypothetical protein GUITHDRAFT_104007 [Guillardia theta CCMP2712]
MQRPTLTEASILPSKTDIQQGYEERIKAFSAPEKVFQLFASVKHEGEALMTPSDFLRSLHPNLMHENAKGKKPSARAAKAARRLFQMVDIDSDGLVSFHEYVFFMTLISIPENRFRTMFCMFDLDRSGEIDEQEFAAMMRVLKSKSPIGLASRVDVVSTSNKVKQQKKKAAELNRDRYPILFGKHGNRKLTYPKFARYLLDLQEDIATLEFDGLNPDADDTISSKDFALSLVSHVYPKQFRVYKGKIEALAESRIGFKDYMAFNKMLKSVEEISSAIDTFSEANSGNFGREHLIHASVAVSNVELSSEVADVLMHVFSDKGKGTLNQEEFLTVMKLKRHYGANRKRQVDVGSFFKCMRTCTKNNLTLV